MGDLAQLSHEHLLELSNVWPQGQTVRAVCNTSMVAGMDFYVCRPCSYYLHCSCFNLPGLIRHLADPDHDSNLVDIAFFGCKACGRKGSGFSCNCSSCLVYYHTQCSSMPQKETLYSHPHLLKLEFAEPYLDFTVLSVRYVEIQV